MPDVLDQSDREICAALLRNGRASWRLIAQATGMQERTVSRRATRMFEQQIVRVTAFARPDLVGRGHSFLARIRVAPDRLVTFAQWFARRPETLWVTTTTTESVVIAECFFDPKQHAAFIHGDLASAGILDFSFAPLHHYRRTVRGWQPSILSEEQLALLGEDETSALVASEAPLTPLDPVDRTILDLLEQDGRMSIDAISHTLGVAKATVRRRISQLQQSDRVSIRAVLDPAVLGYPFEVLIAATPSLGNAHVVASLLAEDRRSRWVAESSADGAVHALMAFADRSDVPLALDALARGLAGIDVHVTVEPLLTMYKRSDIILPMDAESTAS